MKVQPYQTLKHLVLQNSSQVSKVFTTHEKRFIRRTSLAFVLFSSVFLVAKQSLGPLGSYTLTNTQQRSFLGNSVYKYFGELAVHKAEMYCLMDSFSAIEHT